MPYLSYCSSIFNILGLSKPISPPLSNKSVKCSVGITNHVDPVQTAHSVVFFDFSLTVKAAPHECVIRTG